MKKCKDCMYSLHEDHGSSNYTVEGTFIHCLKDLNPDLPEDNFYGEEPALLYAEKCPYYKEGDPIELDVDLDERFEDYCYEQPDDVIELFRQWAVDNVYKYTLKRWGIK